MKKYTTLSEIDHILQRPEVVIGSTEATETQELVATPDFSLIEEKTVTASEAIVRIFVEVLANAVDNILRSRDTATPCKTIKVEIAPNGRTLIRNDGAVISVSKDENCEGLYNHELVFGRLRSSSNYDDSTRREVSGKNGLGVKCTNIFSQSFLVTGVDPTNKKKLVQEWTDNMKSTTGPKITSSTAKTGHTEVIYTPDLARLCGGAAQGYSEDLLGVFRKQVLDIAMIAAADKVAVYFNNTRVTVKKFLDYALLYQPPTLRTGLELVVCSAENSEAVIMFSETKKKPISFVNGLFTKDGGQHVDGWSKPFISQLLKVLNNRKGDLQLTVKDVAPSLRFFVRSIVDKPQFDSQNKHKLKFPQIKYDVQESTVLKVSRWASIQRLKERALQRLGKSKETNIIRKLNNKQKVSIKEYDPANNAGSSKSQNCTLIICEGLSAKTYAVAGINTGISFDSSEPKRGRDWFGILPLRGKFLNVRNASSTKMLQNTVVTDLVKAMGLTLQMDYSTEKARSTLNYGSLVIIPDPDEDGIHIEALILNFFHFHFPSLLKLKTPFISSMKIPVIETTYQKQLFEFYTHSAFQEWSSSLGPSTNLKIKYFKGLGTTTHKDVPRKFGKKMVVFKVDANANQSMEKAFKDDESDRRKEWLQNYSHELRTFSLDKPQKTLHLDISTFIDEELIKFSIEDCRRSIPHLIDGLKESQRKVIYGLKKLSSRDSIKVAQLGAFVAQKTDYKHGEQNLFETIVKMAQSFVGANNIPLLEQDGQFGTRLSGGKDAANPRYIFTKQSQILGKIFREEDEPILLYDEKEPKEPLLYLPTVPLICLNGCVGVGTGFSCNIPMFSPHAIVRGIKRWLTMRADGEKYVFKDEAEETNYYPWYRGFTGTIEKGQNRRFTTMGAVREIGRRDTVREYEVTELPVNMWTDKFKEICEQLVTDGTLLDWKFGNSDVEKISFILTSEQDIGPEDLKLKTYLHTTNMVMFDHNNKIHKYETLNGILQRFCKERVRHYERRRVFKIADTRQQLEVAKNKKRFMEEMMARKISVFMETDESVTAQLTQAGFLRVESSFDYLLRMSVRSFTAEHVQRLKTLIERLQLELQYYLDATDASLWLADLEELEPLLEN